MNFIGIRLTTPTSVKKLNPICKFVDVVVDYCIDFIAVVAGVFACVSVSFVDGVTSVFACVRIGVGFATEVSGVVLVGVVGLAKGVVGVVTGVVGFVNGVVVG